MLNFPRWKVWGISLICLVVSLMAVPSFVPANVFDRLPAFATQREDKYVVWADGTTDEMCLGILTVTRP